MCWNDVMNIFVQSWPSWKKQQRSLAVVSFFFFQNYYFFTFLKFNFTVSLHYGGRIQAPLKIPRTITVLLYSRFKWGLPLYRRQSHLQDAFRLTFSWPFSYISISSFTVPVGAAYRILLLFLPWLPCHFYLVVFKQQQSFAAVEVTLAEWLNLWPAWKHYNHGLDSGPHLGWLF